VNLYTSFKISYQRLMCCRNWAESLIISPDVADFGGKFDRCIIVD